MRRRDSEAGVFVSAWSEVVLARTALRQVIGLIGVGRINSELYSKLRFLHESLGSLERRLKEALKWASTKARAGQQAKVAKAAARRHMDDARALEVLREERARQLHGYLKRAGKRSGYSRSQLLRLQRRKTRTLA